MFTFNLLSCYTNHIQGRKQIEYEVANNSGDDGQSHLDKRKFCCPFFINWKVKGTTQRQETLQVNEPCLKRPRDGSRIGYRDDEELWW